MELNPRCRVSTVTSVFETDDITNSSNSPDLLSDDSESESPLFVSTSGG